MKGADLSGDAAGDGGGIINSYVTLFPQRISEPGYEGKVNKITITTGGGTRDTDSLDYDVYISDTAQGALDSTTAIVSGTVSGVDRAIIRERFAGAFIGVKISNDSASSSWSLEEVVTEAVPAGRVRE